MSAIRSILCLVCLPCLAIAADLERGIQTAGPPAKGKQIPIVGKEKAKQVDAVPLVEKSQGNGIAPTFPFSVVQFGPWNQLLLNTSTGQTWCLVEDENVIQKYSIDGPLVPDGRLPSRFAIQKIISTPVLLDRLTGETWYLSRDGESWIEVKNVKQDGK